MGDYNVNFMEERFPEEWLSAMRANVRRERVSIILSRGGEKTDADIIENSLYINRKVMGSKFDLGTCCISEMGVTFTDENAIDTNYGGVLATVVYSLYVGEDTDGTEKWYFSTAGPFIIDGQKARRLGDQVTIKAYDILSNFDYELPKDNIPKFANLYEAVEWLCNVVPRVNSIRFGPMPESEFNQLPNADIIPDFSSGQIVSCRDALMWIAQATGTCVYYGGKGITFKPYRYTGNMSYDREITVDERDSIEFTDTRTYCAYLTAESAGNAKIYTNVVNWDESWVPQYIKTGGLALPRNPIISALTEEEQDAVNNNILTNMSCPTRYVKMTGDVDFLLEPLDNAAFTGGNIDIRNMIIAPVTEINWKYRCPGKIVCTNVEEYTDTLPDEAAAAALIDEGISAQSEINTVHSPVYSQSDKAQQGLGGDPEKITGKQLPGATLGFEGMCKLIGKVMTGTGDGTKVIEVDLLNNEYTFTRAFDQNSKVKIRHLQGDIVEITVSGQSSSAIFLLYSDGAISTPHFKIQKDSDGEFKGYINNREILTK